jgi:hypothetical protein
MRWTLQDDKNIITDRGQPSGLELADMWDT